MISESKLDGRPAVGYRTLFLSSCCFWECPARHHSLTGPWPANASHPVPGSEVAAIPNDSTRCRTMCTPNPVRLQGHSKTKASQLVAAWICLKQKPIEQSSGKGQPQTNYLVFYVPLCTIHPICPGHQAPIDIEKTKQITLIIFLDHFDC